MEQDREGHGLSGNDGGAPQERHGDYWKRNLRILGVLLAVWFVASYGFGIIFVDALDAVRIPGTGFPLGFWFAQQGSIYVFVVLIFVYVWRMNRLDDEFGVSEEAVVTPAAPNSAQRSVEDGEESK